VVITTSKKPSSISCARTPLSPVETITRDDKNQLFSLLNDYREMVREALGIITRNDVRSRKKAYELCYRILREKYPYLHNKFVQEAYKRALAMYRSYRKLLNKWERLSEKKRKNTSPPSPPSVEDNRVIELHIDTYKLEKDHGFLTLTISKVMVFILDFWQWCTSTLEESY